MSAYQFLKLSEAYRLINHGPLVLISTVSNEWKYNIAPIAWTSPVDNDEIAKLLIVCDKSSKTYQNILYTKNFTLSIATTSMVDLVQKFGETSGYSIDKMNFEFDHFDSAKLGYPVPVNSLGYIDLSVIKIIDEGSVAIIIAEAITAQVLTECWNQDKYIENKANTLHHIGDKVFVTMCKI